MNIKFKNLGTVNKNMVYLGSLMVYFSYETPVSFYNCKTGKKATRVNDWSTTTGKLLNELEPNKENRVDGETFEKELTKELKQRFK